MKATQRGKILAYCMEHGSITNKEAVERLDINSPTKRISEMRHSPDYLVDTIEETRVNNDGETKRYNRYFIKAVTR
jgi:hypothetical protein